MNNRVLILDVIMLIYEVTYGNHGCKGGNMYYAYQYILANEGVDTTSGYPYRGRVRIFLPSLPSLAVFPRSFITMLSICSNPPAFMMPTTMESASRETFK